MAKRKRNTSITTYKKGWKVRAAAASAARRLELGLAAPVKLQGRMKRKITATTNQKKGKKSRDTPSASATPTRSSLAATAS
jgi:hypothetical protein